MTTYLEKYFEDYEIDHKNKIYYISFFARARFYEYAGSYEIPPEHDFEVKEVSELQAIYVDEKENDKIENDAYILQELKDIVWSALEVEEFE